MARTMSTARMASPPPSPPAKRTTQQKTSTAPPSSRRSGRLAGEKPEVEPQTGEKRAAPNAKSDPASKKTKASEPASKKAKTKATTSKAQPKSNSKTDDDKDEADEEDAEEKKEEEKEAEAPASAQAETGRKGALKLGDKLPKISVLDNKGEEVDVSSLAGKKGLVVFIYPKADTPGCTTQACGFRDAFDQISELGYEVYGLSKDKPEAQQKWIDKKDLNYSLLCDPESKLIKRLGAFVMPNNTKRSHFIFEKGSGKLVDLQLGVKPADDPANCLKFIKQHHK